MWSHTLRWRERSALDLRRLCSYPLMASQEPHGGTEKCSITQGVRPPPHLHCPPLALLVTDWEQRVLVDPGHTGGRLDRFGVRLQTRVDATSALISTHSDFLLLFCVGEPSAPILELKVQNRGNSLKVNLIKQDDGGFTHHALPGQIQGCEYPRQGRNPVPLCNVFLVLTVFTKATRVMKCSCQQLQSTLKHLAWISVPFTLCLFESQTDSLLLNNSKVFTSP